MYGLWSFSLTYICQPAFHLVEQLRILERSIVATQRGECVLSSSCLEKPAKTGAVLQR